MPLAKALWLWILITVTVNDLMSGSAFDWWNHMPLCTLITDLQSLVDDNAAKYKQDTQ